MLLLPTITMYNEITFQEEVNLVESYEEIVARVQAWEKKSDLDSIRAELQLQVPSCHRLNLFGCNCRELMTEVITAN